MAWPSSDPAAQAAERRAATTLSLAGGVAVACVVAGMVAWPRLVQVGTVLMMTAPLAALGTVALGILREPGGRPWYAVGALLAIGAGMLLAS